MPSYTYLRRENYGPEKGTYYYDATGWNDRFYRAEKVNVGLWNLTVTDRKTGDVISKHGFRTSTEADDYIASIIRPIKRARQEQYHAERKRTAQEKAEQAARAKAERLAKDSHKDSDVIIKAKITRQEAIKLAERLLHWAVDSNKNEPMDAPIIEFNITYRDDTRSESWRHGANDDRLAVGIGWTSNDDIWPVIEDSYIAKRLTAEPVSVDDDLAAAV